MTKLHKITKLYDMQLHDADGFDKLFSYLHYGYVKKVLEMANEQGLMVTESQIRNIKAGRTKNLPVLKLIIKVAKENKESAEKASTELQQLLNS